jgi:hypothetical protein
LRSWSAQNPAEPMGPQAEAGTIQVIENHHYETHFNLSNWRHVAVEPSGLGTARRSATTRRGTRPGPRCDDGYRPTAVHDAAGRTTAFGHAAIRGPNTANGADRDTANGSDRNTASIHADAGSGDNATEPDDCFPNGPRALGSEHDFTDRDSVDRRHAAL